MIAAEHEVAKVPSSDELADPHHEDERRGHREREDQRSQRQSSDPGWRRWYADEPTEVSERDDHDQQTVHEHLGPHRHEEGRLLDHASESRPDAEYLHGAQRRAERAAVNRRGERDHERSVRLQDIERTVGETDERAEDNHADIETEPPARSRVNHHS